MAADEKRSGGDEFRRERLIGVGCFTFVAGAASGAMIGVLVGKIVGAVQKCPVGEDGMVCNWSTYAGWGFLIGAITLPAIAYWRLLRSGRPGNSDRG